MSCQYAHTAGMPPSDMYPRAGRAATRLLYASHQLHPSHQLYPLHPLQTRQRLLVLHADSLVDGELTGYTATGRPLVRIGTGEDGRNGRNGYDERNGRPLAQIDTGE